MGIGDEYKFMHRNLDAMTKFGFTQADYMQDNSASSNQVYSDWNKGMGMYFYIGHGSGTAWNCPQHTGGFPMSAINSKLTNAGMYPFVLECSCLNGGFKRENPCFCSGYDVCLEERAYFNVFVRSRSSVFQSQGSSIRSCRFYYFKGCYSRGSNLLCWDYVCLQAAPKPSFVHSARL